eukprot:Plantae.Rhodophyta-Purpureofilum_apyrenoidigerum.ctg20487.p1 GENE.Plantae.Rhodophyta-Purpureofilum_apyrenoidigerum.ctg20487~~Plantae.Rhodophyta-Purpureofilum_apyrenoidigerum.ctg20487.p1  ORF type:complete len:553 (-),score=63.79 Plantae.Rhodophyta-Purpureofilum_apyrenoidigerum.ctg20487:576-2234(-)
MLTFGSYFSYDTPGASVSQLLDGRSEANPHMTSLQYNMLYSLYAWPNVVIVFVGGYFIDSAGPIASGGVLLGLVTVGQVISTLGAFVRSVSTIFAGRLIFASGAELLIVCQGAMIFKWFSGKEMAVAFGFSLTFARLGTIACFSFLPNLSERHGVSAAFGVGSVLCIVSDALFLLYVMLDRRADRLLSDEKETDLQELEPGQIEIAGGPFSLSTSFWLCTGTLMSNYGCIMAFLAVAIDYLKGQFGISATTAGLEVSLVYYISMILAPLVGGVLDRYGYRGIVTFCGAIITAFLFCSLSLSPAEGTLEHAAGAASVVAALTGLSLGFLSSSVWPTIPLIVSPCQVGMAIGVAQALQNLGVGISTLVVGHLYDSTHSYHNVMLFFALVALVSVLVATIWNIHDFAVKGKVNSVAVEEADTRYLGGNRIISIEVSPSIVLITKRKLYGQADVRGITLKRRDYYRSLGINESKCLPPQHATSSPIGSYAPLCIGGADYTEMLDEEDPSFRSSSMPAWLKLSRASSVDTSPRYGSTVTVDLRPREAVLSRRLGQPR